MPLKYNRKFKERSRKMRNWSTLSEVLLWNHLRVKKLGYQFLRQKPLGNYIVDFYCPDAHLIVEVDGTSHQGRKEYDRFRDDYFKEIGVYVLRIDDGDVRNNIDRVLLTIARELNLRKSPF